MGSDNYLHEHGATYDAHDSKNSKIEIDILGR